MAIERAAASNRLLHALPRDEWLCWQPRLEPVELPAGQVLYESGCTLGHVVFPTSAAVSLQYVTREGAMAEIAVVGPEGLVGVALFMGGDSMPNRAVVRSGGTGLRMRADAIKEAFERSHEVQHLLLRYTQALITQMAQIAVCNRHHSLERQLCRWLLMALDRLPGGEVHVTHEQIAHMIGVRREGVTEAALALQRVGAIRYSRGHVTVLDRAALERRTCECYEVVRREYERLLPRVHP